MLRSALWASLLLLAACSSGDDSSSAAGGGGTGDGGTGATGSGPNAAVKATCVNEINMYRATLSLPAYTEWTDGETCADGEAQSDSASGKAHGAFGTCKESAQDECPGWPGSDLDGSIKGCLKMMWAEGPGTDFSTHGHYINMSSAQYTQVACGFYVTAAGEMWSVQNFK
jgi:hypothetical protein